MDNHMYDDEKNDNDELVFQDLAPEQPANTLQKSMIRIQRHWPRHWSKRYWLFWMALLSGILIILLVFELIHLSARQIATTDSVPGSTTTTTTNVMQVLTYDNSLYILTNQTTNNNGQLESIDIQTGKPIWSYAPYNTKVIKLVGNILYIQTDTHLVALNAANHTLLWEKQTSDDNYGWQIDQDTLFTLSADGTITVMNAATGAPLWQKNQTHASWQADHGIFYMQIGTDFRLTAFNAKNGKLLWYNPGVGPDWMLGNGNVYVKDNPRQRIEALSGANGKTLWQINTNGEDPSLSIQKNYLLLSNAQKTTIEVRDNQSGKLLWQHPGMLYTPTEENPDQVVISSLQKNEIDVLRITDGTLRSHFLHTNVDSPSVVTLLSLDSSLAFFLYYTQNGSVQYIDPKVVAVRISTGSTIWSSQESTYIAQPRSNTIVIMPLGSNTLIALRTDNGRTQWSYAFTAARN